MEITIETEAKVSEIWSLLDLIRDAAGPNVAIDARLMALTYQRGRRHIGGQEESSPGEWVPFQDEVWIDPITDKWVTTARNGFEYTASLDRATLFVERLFSGCEWTVGKTQGADSIGKATVRVHALLSVEEEAATPALALIAAGLHGMILRGDGGRS